MLRLVDLVWCSFVVLCSVDGRFLGVGDVVLMVGLCSDTYCCLFVV